MGVHAVERAEVDDVAATLGAHGRHGRLHGPERPVEADLETVGHLRIRLVLEPAQAAPTPRVVDENVHRPPAIGGDADHGAHGGLVGDVSGDGMGLGSEFRAELAGHRSARIGVQFSDQDPGALPAKARAMPRPIPSPAPVMIATRSCSRPIHTLLISGMFLLANSAPSGALALGLREDGRCQVGPKRVDSW